MHIGQLAHAVCVLLYHVVHTCCGVNLYCYSNGAELAVPTRYTKQSLPVLYTLFKPELSPHNCAGVCKQRATASQKEQESDYLQKKQCIQQEPSKCK